MAKRTTRKKAATTAVATVEKPAPFVRGMAAAEVTRQRALYAAHLSGDEDAFFKLRDRGP